MDFNLLRRVHGHRPAEFAKESPVLENMTTEPAQSDKEQLLGITRKAVRGRDLFLMEQRRSAIIRTIVFRFAEQNCRQRVNRNFNVIFARSCANRIEYSVCQAYLFLMKMTKMKGENLLSLILASKVLRHSLLGHAI